MHFAELSQGRVAYWAAGDGPPVLFIHGVGTTGELWFRDLQPLASRYRLIVHNRRGYGESTASPREWTGHRDDAAALLAALGVKRAAVVGYSAGASVALALALQEPDLVSSLVLLDPAVNIRRCMTVGFAKTLLVTSLLRRLRSERAGARDVLG